MVNRRRIAVSIDAKIEIVMMFLVTADGKLFQTVGAEMQKARTAVVVLVDGTVSRTEFDERRERTG